MKPRYLLILLLLVSVLGACNLDDFAKVTIVAVPPKPLSQNEHIYISGGHIHFGEWEPDGAVLLKQPDGSFRQTFLLEKNRYIDFKFTRGTWNTEALDDSGRVSDNLSFLVEKDTTLRFEISGWQDQRPKL